MVGGGAATSVTVTAGVEVRLASAGGGKAAVDAAGPCWEHPAPAAAFGASERGTISRPRTVGADLREARAAAASTTEGAGAKAGEATDSFVADMRSAGHGSAGGTAESAATCCEGGWREDAAGMPDLVVVVGDDAGGGKSGRRRRQHAGVSMVAASVVGFLLF